MQTCLAIHFRLEILMKRKNMAARKTKKMAAEMNIIVVASLQHATAKGMQAGIWLSRFRRWSEAAMCKAFGLILLI